MMVLVLLCVLVKMLIVLFKTAGMTPVKLFVATVKRLATILVVTVVPYFATFTLTIMPYTHFEVYYSAFF